MPELCNRPPEILTCFSCVAQVFLTCSSCFARVLLMFCLCAPAFYRLETHGIPFAAQCGATIVPFYSTKKENLSKNRSQVVQPQRETWILIQNGNAVAQPPCQTFHSRIFIQKGNTAARSPSQILRVWCVIKKGRWWQKSLFQLEFLLYFNRKIGNSCKIMNKITNNLHLHHNII